MTRRTTRLNSLRALGVRFGFSRLGKPYRTGVSFECGGNDKL